MDSTSEPCGVSLVGKVVGPVAVVPSLPTCAIMQFHNVPSLPHEPLLKCQAPISPQSEKSRINNYLVQVH
jgi:hypothetical protein